MNIKRIFAVYFSPCNNVKIITKHIAAGASHTFDNCTLEDIDFTLPAAREKKYSFNEEDLVIFGTPVYAGRVPNKILPFVQEGFEGNGALAISSVAFGNRNFDNGLSELSGELKNNGFKLIGAAAIPTQHSFSKKLAHGRPDKDDIDALYDYGAAKANIIMSAASKDDIKEPEVPGEYPPPAYYTPLKKDGTPAKFLKASPLTKTELCINCKTCVKNCPMGSIEMDDISLVKGICIKCQSCVNKCPKGAKYFEDPDFLSHVEMLEENYADKVWELLLN